MNAKRFSRTGPRAATTRLGRRAASRPRVPTPAWSAWLVLVSAISLSAPAPAMGAPRNLVIDADYFVDQTNAACSDAGAGTQAQPYCTITAALAAHHGPGAVINVMPGHYREQVTLPASGASGSLIILKANPSPGQPVIVDGTDDFSSTALWTQSSGDEWLAASVTWAPKQVFADDARLTPATASPGSLPPRSFTYVAGSGLYVNAGGGNPGSHGAQVGHRLYGFYVSGKSYVHIEGFTVLRGDDRCIQLTNGATNVEIVGNRVREAGRMGIQVVGGSAVRIAANVVSDNGDHGIALITGATGCTIEDNESFRNSYALARQANGLYMFGCPSNVIQRNRWHDNQDTGEHMQSGSDNNLSIQNISWANGDHGYDRFSCSGNIQIGDVAYGNYKDGFSIEGNSPNHQLFNSIAVDNGLTTNEADLWVDQGSSSGFVSDYNIFWNSTSQAPIKYIAFTPYSTISAYSAVSGQDTHSIQADPKFVASASGDFHLLAGSPAIDDANSGVANWPSTDAEGNARVDDRHTPNTGLGPVPYADRGALEFQPPPNQPPIAALTVTPSSGTEPLGVTADASASTDPDGTIASYRFDFGDGTMVGPQPGATATHTYAAGNWTATVEVTDSDGAIATKSAAVTVSPRPNQPPTAALTVTPSSGTEPLGVTADASGSSDPDGTIASYRFDFGDGTAVGPTPVNRVSHTYAAGNWTASVQVTDNGGASATKSVTVAVARPNQPPTAALTVTPSSGTEPLGVTADASGSSDPDGTIASYRFDFGDGTVVGPQPGATATHTYAAGSWTATVQVTDNRGASATKSVTVTVARPNQPPTAALTVTPSSGTEPLGVTADASGSSDPDGTIASYRFDFGDGTVVGPTPVNRVSHTYAAGNWTASVQVTDNGGATATKSVTVAVARPNQPPTAALAVTPSSGMEPLGVTADASGSSDPDGTIASYRFDFGDGTVVGPQPGATATHTYAAGSWTATVQVTDNAGASSTASVAVSVSEANLVGNPSFEANTDGWAPIGGATLARAPGGSSGIFSLQVKSPLFGTTPYGVTDQPDWVTSTPGAGVRYHLKAWVKAAVGSSLVSIRLRESLGSTAGQWIESPRLALSPSWQALELDYVTRWAGSDLDLQIVGQPAVLQQAFLVDDVSITLPLSATANLPPTAALVMRPSSGTEPLPVTADASGSSDPEGQIASYRFDFGDGTVVGPQPAATATHTYAAGTWTPTVQVTDAGGVSATTSGATVTVAPHVNLPPIAALAVTPSSGMEPLEVKADASGSSDPDGAIASYRFDFDDGTVVGPQVAATATHTYAAGNWTAIVQVTDAEGLSTTKSVAVSVAHRNLPPIAALAVTPASGTEPLDVTADASASSDPEGRIASYHFDFGDGTAVGPQPVATATHTYAAGNWTAIVQVTDAGGLSCTKSVAVSVAHRNLPPIAALAVTPSSGTEPLDVTADASGSSDPEASIASYRFDFGDGTVAGPQPAATATHTYAAGNWTASVQVTDAGGLSATQSVAVSVLPSKVNLVGNPSFESDISGWAAIGGAALARVPGGSDGSYSLRVASPLASTSPYGVTDQPAWVATTPAAGARYRIGAWVRADLGTSIVSLRVRESLGGTVGAWVESSRLALSLSWQVLQIDYVTRWAGSTLDLQVVGQPAAAQQAFRVDDVSILRPPTGSQVPLAVLSLSPPTGTAPLRVTADASASIIPTGTVASYRFDFGDGTVVGPQPSATAEHIYPDGQWTASVEVSAGSGTSCGFSQAVSVGAVPNLVRGSSFETDMSGWVPVTEALLSMAAQAYDGSHSLEVGGVHADSRIFGVTDMPKAVPSNPAAGTTYRIQACLRDQIAAGAGWIRVREDLNGKRSDWVTSRDTTLSASWTLVQLDYRSLWTGSTLDFQIVGRGTGQSRHGFTKVSPAFCVDAIYIVAFPPAAAPASSAIAARSEATSADASRTETTAADATLADATPATPMPGMAPNPLRSEARLAFATARDGRVSVGIFDLAGRRVRRLQDGPMAAGLHAISFDGRDDDGARLRNGVYCYRIGSADGSRAGRFAILR